MRGSNIVSHCPGRCPGRCHGRCQGLKLSEKTTVGAYKAPYEPRRLAAPRFRTQFGFCQTEWVSQAFHPSCRNIAVAGRILLVLDNDISRFALGSLLPLLVAWTIAAM